MTTAGRWWWGGQAVQCFHFWRQVFHSGSGTGGSQVCGSVLHRDCQELGPFVHSLYFTGRCLSLSLLACLSCIDIYVCAFCLCLF